MNIMKLTDIKSTILIILNNMPYRTSIPMLRPLQNKYADCLLKGPNRQCVLAGLKRTTTPRASEAPAENVVE